MNTRYYFTVWQFVYSLLQFDYLVLLICQWKQMYMEMYIGWQIMMSGANLAVVNYTQFHLVWISYMKIIFFRPANWWFVKQWYILKWCILAITDKARQNKTRHPVAFTRPSGCSLDLRNTVVTFSKVLYVSKILFFIYFSTAIIRDYPSTFPPGLCCVKYQPSNVLHPEDLDVSKTTIIIFVLKFLFALTYH